MITCYLGKGTITFGTADALMVADITDAVIMVDTTDGTTSTVPEEFEIRKEASIEIAVTFPEEVELDAAPHDWPRPTDERPQPQHEIEPETPPPTGDPRRRGGNRGKRDQIMPRIIPTWATRTRSRR